jgi:hypothetical protein
MGVNIVQLLKTIQSPESGVSVGFISSMPLVKEKVGSVTSHDTVCYDSGYQYVNRLFDWCFTS